MRRIGGLGWVVWGFFFFFFFLPHVNPLRFGSGQVKTVRPGQVRSGQVNQIKSRRRGSVELRKKEGTQPPLSS